ncbi:MAG: hypothetical protein MI700_09760 [Balneolales bacterium]|nr:hypothetical protein [Balneolales bacterium]
MKVFERQSRQKCRVFKTNVGNELAASRLVYVLEHSKGIENWNLDMEDHDRVLRINYSKLHLFSFVNALSVFDIEIEELPIW